MVHFDTAHNLTRNYENRLTKLIAKSNWAILRHNVIVIVPVVDT